MTETCHRCGVRPGTDRYYYDGHPFSLAGAQPKLPVKHTIGCDECWTEFTKYVKEYEAGERDADPTYHAGPSIRVWWDGERYHPVVEETVSGASRSHYYVQGFGQGDGSICGVPYTGPRKGITTADLLLCETCERRTTFT